VKYGYRFSLAVTAGVFLTFVASPQSGPGTQGGRQAQRAPASQKPAADSQHGLNPADFDRTCKPCEDFYHYVNGGWIAHNPIPAAYPSWGRMNLLAEHNRDVLHDILEKAAADKSAVPGSPEQKIGDFYASCMDSAKIDAAGIHPLDDELARIAKITDRKSLEDEAAHLQGLGVGVMFDFGSTIDFKNSSEQTGDAEQGGLGLPDRDYYTKTDDQSAQIRVAYEKHITKLLTLAGDSGDRAGAESQAVIALETKLASASMTRVELRDPQAIYHRMGLDDLKMLTPDFDWPAYFHDIGFAGINVVNVGQLDFFKQLDARLNDVSMDDWKTYLRWHLIHAASPYLSTAFVDETFDFYNRVLTGTTEQLPRWRRCVGTTDRELGEALGRKYVERAFPPEAKARALEMVHNLIDALRADIQTLDWMSAPTKVQALAKLNSMMLKIGYPDKWLDYSAYEVDRGPYVQNIFRGNQFAFHRDLAKIGQPVDRAEWEMTPPTVNAYYNPQLNEIVFPAGILQPPAFDPKADDALNYGAMGAVIGHEMTHGFDDEGRQFDAQGNLHDWWTPEDSKNFDQRAACIEKQFDGFVVAGDLRENGKLVLGESIADLGGLTIAYSAFEKSREDKAPVPIDGFTPVQRFFIAYARVWGESARPEFERLLATTDPHPLARFRAVGVLSNMPQFAKAFSCKEGDAMVRPADQRCRIW